MSLAGKNISELRHQDSSWLRTPLTQGQNGQLLRIGLTDVGTLEYSNSLVIKVKNVTGSTILAGTPVQALNGDGTLIFIEPLITGNEFIGITHEMITNNSEGFVVVLGEAPFDWLGTDSQ